MNIIVHLMFSYNMRKIIRKESGIKLNLLGFMYGNILPDLSSRFSSQPHNIKGSLNFIINKTHTLLNGACKNVYSHPYRYSKNLGVITHYISDYFCYPHQDHYNKGLKDHSIYELIMITKYRRGLKDFREKYDRSHQYLAPEELKSWILERHLDYSGLGDGSCINDISHALYAGSMVGGSMIQSYTNQLENPEAIKPLKFSGQISGVRS